MYNHLRKCLIVSLRIHRKLLTQKSNQGILLPMTNCYASFCICNNTSKIYKRFYCQIAINQKIEDETNAIKNDAQQELDEFMSIPENRKRYQILELEVDVIRHNSKEVPEKLHSTDWLTLLKLPSKRQRKLVSFESFFFFYYFPFKRIIYLQF